MNSSTNNSDVPSDIKSMETPSKKVVPNFVSEQLFGDSKEITIEHENSTYRLRITKQGKLILNK
ncbi:MAG: hemin uptake protein HemP [Pseudomonadota bacterium]